MHHSTFTIFCGKMEKKEIKLFTLENYKSPIDTHYMEK